MCSFLTFCYDFDILYVVIFVYCVGLDRIIICQQGLLEKLRVMFHYFHLNLYLFLLHKVFSFSFSFFFDLIVDFILSYDVVGLKMVAQL